MARILVTGANGHIGSNIVRELCDRGHEVVAFVRATADRQSLDGLPVEIAIGDVVDRASLAPAMARCDAIIHCAASFTLWGDADAITATSVTGTENVISLARDHGIRRVVATSSCAVAGFTADPGELRSEDDWREETHLAYYRAKLAGERAAMTAAQRTGVELVSILPTQVLGPHDYRLTPSMRPLLDIAIGKAPTIDGGTNVVAVQDVARAHVAALDRARPGERYLIGGDNLTLRDVGAIVARLTGRRVKHARMPRWLLLAAAAVMELGARFDHSPPAMTRDAVRDVAGRYAWFDCRKARSELGLEPAGGMEVIACALGWFLVRGLLPAAIAGEVERRLGALIASGEVQGAEVQGAEVQPARATRPRAAAAGTGG
jgi:dihydroflavonol-4-reductase